MAYPTRYWLDSCGEEATDVNGVEDHASARASPLLPRFVAKLVGEEAIREED
jgi:hypothetical protein